MKPPLRMLVLIWLCSLAAVSYLQRNLGVAESTLRAGLNLSKDDMGLVQSCFFWSYALLQVPAAWLGHRWGSRVGLSFFCLLWSIATGLNGLATSFEMLCVARFLVGAGQAVALPCIAEVVALWFPQSQRGRATGWIAASMQIGAIVNAFYTAPILKAYSLSGYFYFLAAPGIVWAVGFYAWFRDRPTDFKSITPQELAGLPASREQQGGAGDFSWWRLLASPVLWLICGQQFCRAAGYIFFGTWFATYMQETRHFNVNESGIATGSTFAGVLFGALAGGTISDWIFHRTGSLRWAYQGVAITSLLMCSGCIAASFAITGNDRVAGLLCVALMTAGGFFSGVAGPAGYTVTMNVSGRHVAAVFGWMNMSGNLGAALFPLIIPKLQGPARDNWNLVIVVFAVLYLVAALFWALISPHGSVFGEKPQDPVDISK